MPTKSVQDLSGTTRDSQIKQQISDTETAAREEAEKSEVERVERETTVVDTSPKKRGYSGDDVVHVDEIVVLTDDDQKDSWVVIRLRESLYDMTYGAHTYTFDAGTRYKVPNYIKDHLESIGRLG